MDLLEKCINTLKNKITILTKKEGDVISDHMENTFPMTNWARIDWKKVKKSITVEYISEITDVLELKNEGLYPIYIIWDEATLPVIRSDAVTVLNSLRDVLAVSFDTWLYNPEKGYVIEFYHDGETTIGWTEK